MIMKETTPGMIFADILQNESPNALAWIRGNRNNPQLSGLVKFFNTPYEGIIIESEIFGLPNITVPGSSNFYAMHIHEEGECDQPGFSRTGEHYTKGNELHPQHSGDLIPLMGNQGYAWNVFYNKRISIDDIIGRSVVIHALPDNFTTQPSGKSGEKIGCGFIR